MNTQAWTKASEALMAEFCRKTGTKEGQNAFQFWLPPRVNAWALLWPGGGEVDNTHCGATELVMECQIQGRYAKPDEAQKKAMEIMSAIPFEKNNVVAFQLTAQPSIEGVDFRPPNEERLYHVYLLRMSFRVVFTTT